MKTKISVLAFAAILAFSSCSKEHIKGNGTTVTETRTVSGFSKIDASGSSKVYITQGAVFKVEVKGYSNLLPYYETKQVNNTLQLGYKQNANVKNDNIEVYVTLPILTGLELEGSGDIHTAGVFAGNATFEAKISGSGNIYFSNGTTNQYNATISGSGNIYTLDMVTDKADIDISGSGSTEITALTQLKVKIAGSGNVYYRGTPVITTNISGSGAVLPK